MKGEFARTGFVAAVVVAGNSIPMLAATTGFSVVAVLQAAGCVARRKFLKLNGIIFKSV